MHPILFKIGPLTIYTYGVFALLGIVVASMIAGREARRCGLDNKKFFDLVFWSVVWGFVGARLVYMLVEFKAFLADPLALIFNRAGFVFYGGIVFGLAALFFLSRRYRLDQAAVTDSIALGLPFGHALGRLGCFFYGCCYGRATDSWIGMIFPAGSPAGICGDNIIPTQLISAFFLLLIGAILFFLRTRLKQKGRVALLYLVFYGSFRFSIEFFRGDPRGFLGGLSVSQWFSLFAAGAGLVGWKIRWLCHRSS